MNLPTTPTPDTFGLDCYWSTIARRFLFEWAYRDGEGILHAGVATSASAAFAEAKFFGCQVTEADFFDYHQEERACEGS